MILGLGTAFEIQSTVTIETPSAPTSSQKRCQFLTRIMTQTNNAVSQIRIPGGVGPKTAQHITSSGLRVIQEQDHQRSSPMPCGLFSSSTEASKLPACSDIDIDSDAFLSLIKPKVESQLSILSTDSGILPKDIRDSFVDDVIGELTCNGISHLDLITEEATKEDLTEPVYLSTKSSTELCSHTCKRKAALPISSLLSQAPISPESSEDAFSLTKSDSQTGEEIKRIKNNEASRKSRAQRKWKNTQKEQEISSLEEENQRLSLILQDFNEVAATCKRWIVQRMDNPAEA